MWNYYCVILCGKLLKIQFMIKSCYIHIIFSPLVNIHNFSGKYKFEVEKYAFNETWRSLEQMFIIMKSRKI